MVNYLADGGSFFVVVLAPQLAVIIFDSVRRVVDTLLTLQSLMQFVKLQALPV